MHPTNCLNCEAELHTGFKYCAKCGQKAETHRLNFHEVSHDALHYLTHADKGLLLLGRELILRPGTMAREYMAGKRQQYYKPVSFFLLVGAILVFMTSYFHLVDDRLVKQMEAYASTQKDPKRQQSMFGKIERVKQTNHYISKYSNVMNMLATPLFAAMFWLFYKRAGYSYIEHLVANMYFISFTMLIYAFLVVPWQHLLSNSKMPWIFVLVFFIFEITYRAFAYYHFINKKGAGQFWKAWSVSLFTVLVWTTGNYFLIQHYINTGFK